MFKKFDIIAFLAGLTSLLFVPTPFGRVALFELASYLFAIIIIIRGKYKKYTPIQSRILLFSFIWLFSTILTDLIRNEASLVLFKSALIVLSVPCVLIVAFYILNRNKMSFLWFIVGYGISGVASLYIFHNGAFLYYAQNPSLSFFDITPYLVKKQYMPFYFGGVIYSILFPISVFHGIKYFLLGIFFAFGALFLLTVGSRLNFLTYSITAILTFIFSFSNRTIKKIFNNAVKIFIVIIIIAFGTFQLYEYAASEGLLGESERQKFEAQILYSEYGAFGGRETSIQAFEYAFFHPIVGTGSSRKNQDQPNLLVSGHSIIFGSWAINGIGGLIFWGYVVIVLLKFIQRIYLIDKTWLPFIVFLLLEAFWHIFFSPFGYYRGFLCIIIAFSALQIKNTKEKMV